MIIGTKEILGIASVFLTLASTGTYAVSALRGTARPHLFTWLLWALSATIGCFIQYNNHAGPGMWSYIMNTVLCFCVVALCLGKSDKSHTRKDRIALVLTLLVIPAWYLVKTPVCPVIALTAISLSGFYMAAIKSWHTPFDEPAFPYFVWGCVSLLSLLSLLNYSAVTIIMPLSYMVANFGMCAMLIGRRHIGKTYETPIRHQWYQAQDAQKKSLC